jgi:hypothetical protein
MGWSGRAPMPVQAPTKYELVINLKDCQGTRPRDAGWQALDLLARGQMKTFQELAILMLPKGCPSDKQRDGISLVNAGNCWPLLEWSTQVQKPIPNCQQPIPKRQRYPECNANSGCNVKMLGHGWPPAIDRQRLLATHYAILTETSDNVLRPHAAHSGTLKAAGGIVCD